MSVHDFLAAPPPSDLRSWFPHPHQIIEFLPTAIYACDAEGRLLWFNSRATALWGRTPCPGDDAERFGGSYKTYVDGREVSREGSPIAQVLESGEPVGGVEVLVERPDGSRVWTMVHIDPVKDENGNLIGAINCFHETVGLRQANEELRRQHEELEDFFENCAVGLHMLSEDGRIMRANKAELELLGYSADEYVGRHISEINADAQATAEILRRLKRGEELDKYPVRLRARDGSIKHVLIRSNGQFRDGAFHHTRCFTLDVTELKQAQDQLAESERYFREMIDSLPTAIYMTDAEGRVTYYNRAAVELSGREPEVGSDRWCVTWRLYRADGTPLPLDECPMALALQEGRAIRDAEIIAERPDGTRVPIIPYPTPLHDSAGRVVGAVNVLVDISERRHSETQKQLLLDELNHRIKNKVQMLHSLLRIAMDKTRSSEARSVLNDVARRVAAIAAAQRVLYDANSPYSFDVQELVASVCTDAARSFSDNVGIDYTADAGRLANGSAMPVALILNELLTNAVKYGADDRGAVSIRVQLSDAGEAHVLVVEDDGPGFEFERANSHSSGLALVTGLARQLGGTFEVRRATGAQCIVTFPKRGDTYNDDATASAEERRLHDRQQPESQ